MNSKAHAGRFFMGLAVIFLSFALLLILLKFAFALFIWNALQEAPGHLIALALVRGIPFQTAILAVVVGPAILLFYLAYLLRWRWIKMGLVLYLAGMAGLLALIGLLDLQYFEESGKHISYEATRYLNSSALPLIFGAFSLHPWLSVTTVILLLLIIVGTAGLFSKIVAYTLPSTMGRPSLLVLLSFLPLAAAGYLATCRGLKPRFPEIGAASISSNPYINALCLDPLFGVLDSLTSRGQEYRFYTDAFNVRHCRELLSHEAPFQNSDYPMLRASPGTVAGNRKNILLFILESWSGKDVGVLGGPAGATPFFDELSQQGILFNHFYATGVRSSEGIFSILCSFPNQPAKPIMDRPNVFVARWRSLSEITAEAGYTNIFVHGRDLNFDNLKNFLQTIHFHRIIDRNNFLPSAAREGGSWPGYDDEEVMRRANAEFAAQAASPFLGIIYTMNTHPPFVTPQDFPRYFHGSGTQVRFLNSLRYADHTLKIFFELARKETYFTNTVFLFVADHARTRDTFNFDSQHRIPFLIYSPDTEVVAPRLSQTTASQLDILPTVLGLLNLKTTHASWGRNLLADSAQEGFALSISGTDARWHERDYLLQTAFTQDPPLLFNLARDPECRQDIWAAEKAMGLRLQTNLLAYVALSQTLLFEDRIFPRAR